MGKIKVVHYINNFFAGIGGEEKADIPPFIKDGIIGPGIALQKSLGDDYEVIATAVCGDSYFGENIDEAEDKIISLIEKYSPDLFVAGPAFNAGRYGIACGSICKAVEERLGIPSLTGMYVENPGTDMFKKDVYIIRTGDSAADMRKSMPKIASLAKKMAEGREILGPDEEGYHERGIRVNYFNDVRGSERGIRMLLKKMVREEFVTEYPMPKFDRVVPGEPIKDMAHSKVALVTSGGIVPKGNPDHIESSSATKFGRYSIEGMDRMDKNNFVTIHGGYDRTFVSEDPNLVIPLDVVRELVREGRIGSVAEYFFSTTGTGTSIGNAVGFGKSIGKQLVDDNVDAVILVST